MPKPQLAQHTRPPRRARAHVLARQHRAGGTVQGRGFDGLLKLESLGVKTPSQQTALSLANTHVKSSNRADKAGAASSVKSNQFAYDDENCLTEVTGTSTQIKLPGQKCELIPKGGLVCK